MGRRDDQGRRVRVRNPPSVPCTSEKKKQREGGGNRDIVCEGRRMAEYRRWRRASRLERIK